MKRAAGVACILLLSALALTAETVPARTLTIPSARTAALGGAHAALADDLGSLFSNPAGLYSAAPALYLTELTLGLSGPVFSISNIMFQVMGGKNFGDILATAEGQKLIRNLNAGMSLIGPLSFGYVGKGLGFSLINDTGMDFTSVGSTSVKVGMWERTVLNGGYAFRVFLPEDLQSTLDIGVNLKAFIQGRTEFTKAAIEIPDLFTSGADAIMGKPFSTTTGIGMDVGALYSYSDFLAFGLTVRNLFTPTYRSAYSSLSAFIGGDSPLDKIRGQVPLDMSFGVRWTPRIAAIDQYLKDLKLMLDYRDILDFLSHPASSINPVLKAGLGLEFKLLQVLWIRAGFNEGLLAAGLGLDFLNMQFSASMYGAEMSSEPGMRPVFNMLLGFSLKI